MNKGSSLIVVLIIMAFVAVAIIPLAVITNNEEKMSVGYEGAVSAFYIADAGLERTVSTIKKDLDNKFSINLNQGDIYTINRTIENYFIYEFHNTFKDTDGNYLSQLSGKDCSYNVIIKKLFPLEYSDRTCKKVIQINSQGNFQKWSREISVLLSINFTFDSQDSSGPDNYYINIDSYIEN